MGDLSHNPEQRLKKEIGIFAVLAVCDHHVSSILAMLFLFLGGRGEGMQNSFLFLARPRLTQGLSKAYHLSPY